MLCVSVKIITQIRATYACLVYYLLHKTRNRNQAGHVYYEAGCVVYVYIVFISFNNVYKQQKYACMCRLNPHDGKEFPHNTSTGIVDRVPVLDLLLS